MENHTHAIPVFRRQPHHRGRQQPSQRRRPPQESADQDPDGRSPPQPSSQLQSSTGRALQRFQSDWNLDPDAVVTPGGPSERTMDLALESLAWGGRDGMEEVRAAHNALTAAGLALERDSMRTDASGPWRDGDGNAVPRARLRDLLRDGETASGVTLANVLRRDRVTGKHLLPDDKETEHDTLTGVTSPYWAPRKGPEFTKLVTRVFGGAPETVADAPAKLGAARSLPPPDTSAMVGDRDPIRRSGSAEEETGRAPDAREADAPGSPRVLAQAGSRPGAPTKSATKSSVDAAERKLRLLVQMGRLAGHDQAAFNLERFLDGSGLALHFSRAEAREFEPIRRGEAVNRRRHESKTFLGKTGESSIDLPLRNLSDGQTVVVKHDQNFDYVPTDAEAVLSGESGFYLAFGKTRMTSTVNVKATRRGGRIFFEGSVAHDWSDRYDFHEGASEADEALMVQQHRGAKPFDFGGRWTQLITGTVDIRNGKLVNPRIKWTDQVENDDE